MNCLWPQLNSELYLIYARNTTLIIIRKQLITYLIGKYLRYMT